MSKELQVSSFANQWNEPIWPYDLDDSYLQIDLGDVEKELYKDVPVFKKPWFKQNYRHTSPRNPRFYRRPFFEVEIPE